jgi:type IV pilus assembly protein PilM
MELSFQQNNARGSAGLDIDGGFLAAAQVAGGRIAAAASSELEAGVVSEGEVADVSALSAALKQFFKERDLPRNVRLGVANQQIVVRQIELPLIQGRTERDAAVRFQAAEAIAMPLEEAVLDYHVTREDAGAEGEARMQVVVVAARKAMITRLVEAVRGAGLKPEGIDLNAFALVRTLSGQAEPNGSARVHCHLAGVTNLAIALGTHCVFTRPLATAWEASGEGTAPALADEIRLSIDYYMTQADVLPVGDVVLSGPGSRIEGLAGELGGLVGLPTAVAEPLGELDAMGLPPEEDPHRHTVAAGLAMGAA